MREHDDDSTDHLDDSQLLAQESMQRDEFQRLERQEPRLRDTTYGLLRGSREVVEAWERWWKTNDAARMRGLASRGIGR